MALRNAASVLPDPVGAAMSVWRPSRIAAQPRSCADVGAPSVSSNQRATSGWNPGNIGGDNGQCQCQDLHYVEAWKLELELEFDKHHIAVMQAQIPFGGAERELVTIADGATWLKHCLSLDEQRALVDRVPRDHGRPGGRLRADRARRR